jgi:hypothetical protein
LRLVRLLFDAKRSLAMHRLSIILVIILCCSPSVIFCSDDDEDVGSDDSEASPSIDVVELLTLPDNTEVIRVDSLDYIKQNNKKHQMMGVSDEKCDNASVSED